MSRDLLGDPACWAWPLPHVLFSGEAEGYAFMKWWNRGCAICGDEGQLVEDHDHESMLVRGWLCYGCNTAEGRELAIGGDSVTVFTRYREHCPAVMLGVAVTYGSKGHRAGLWRAHVPESEHPPIPPAQAQEVLEGQIAVNLRAARIACGLSQREVACMLRERGFDGFHQQTLTRVELGIQVLTISQAYAISGVYGITLAALVGEEAESAADPAA